MSINIDRETTALVVIDLQKGIAAMGRQMAPYTVEAVVNNAARLADEFRKNRMPVFLVHVTGSPKEMLNPTVDENPWRVAGAERSADWAEFVPEIGPKEGDIIITKRQWGAFYGTDLELQLRRRGMKSIVLCGISTTHGVESTARFAYEYGFEQIFAEDAMTAMSQEMHNGSISNFRRMGRVRKTTEIIEALQQ
ncbi:MAG: hydrolase [Candidatus Micrarchaeaceae archaeon]